MNYPYGYGYVYFLGSKEGFYKIGSSGNPSERIASFEPKLPFEVTCSYLFQCAPGNEGTVERMLHVRFAEKRTRGEWFRLEEEDLEFLHQNPLPLPIAVGHAACYAHQCLAEWSDCYLLDQMVGLS
jgi:hypothetical protein